MKFLACSRLMCGGSGGTFGIGLDLEHHRTIGRQRFVPGGADTLGVVDEDALEPDQLGEAGDRARRGCAAMASNFGSPSITRCSQVTWFRSSLFKTQQIQCGLDQSLPVL